MSKKIKSEFWKYSYNSLVILAGSLSLLLGCTSTERSAFEVDNTPEKIEGYTLVWHDEFNEGEKPDEKKWSYEYGFKRNRELQWYQEDNATLKDDRLVIEGRREQVKNDNYNSGSDNWRKNRKFAEYTSSSINTRDKYEFKYGIMKVRARLDTASGMWPAIWTLGTNPDKGWPANGEVDVMEFYQIDGEQTILANAAWSDGDYSPIWDSAKIPFEEFLKKDSEWTEKFHVWKMDWNEERIHLYLDGELLNEIDLSETLNKDGYNPFHQPHYILLNLAIGSNGGNPAKTTFPKQYEVDYVRVYQKR